MTVSDEQIGKNVARLRGTRSQQSVADGMRARGWRWSQATVWAVEKGERPLRLAEAEDLALELRQTGGSVFARGEWDTRFDDAWAEAHEAYDVLEVAAGQYMAAQLALAITAADDRVQVEGLDDVREFLRVTPEEIVRQRRGSLHLENVEPGSLVAELLAAYDRERK